MLPDLIEGRVSMAIDSMPAHLPHIKTGRLRALAVANPQRSAQLPDVPTISEAGVPGISVEHGLRALRAGRHAERNRRALESRNDRGAGQPDLKARLAALGIEVSGSTPDALRAEVLAEFDKWAKVLKEGTSSKIRGNRAVLHFPEGEGGQYPVILRPTRPS
jgi:tripartite-type tricarboxylate transporter receptor subunit TctC